MSGGILRRTVPFPSPLQLVATAILTDKGRHLPIPSHVGRNSAVTTVINPKLASGSSALEHNQREI